ncbi:MAG: NfeD family protein, partial [Megasphaera sp.]
AYITSRAWSAGALIALSSRHIIMAPGSSIGAAEPIPDTEKNIAALKAEFSATAAQTGHNPGVAEAMVDKTKGYPGYAEPGKILALSDGQAKELNVSDGSADTLSDALALYSLGDAQTIYVDKDWRDDMIGILQNPYVRTLFVALIIAALLAEIKMAGIGAGIATAVVFGGLLLYSGNEPLVADLKIIAAFLVSLLCIGLELASPGIGIFGLAGVVLLFGSLFFMLGATYESVYILAGGTVLAIVVFYFLGRHLPKSSLFDKLTLKNRSTKEKGYTSQEDYSRYLYERGTTITILRPSGTIRIGKERVDAVANGSFIDRDVTVRVISVEGGRIVVEPEPERHPKD